MLFRSLKSTNDVLLVTLTGCVIPSPSPKITPPVRVANNTSLVILRVATGKIEIGLYSAIGLYLAVIVSDMVIQGIYSAKSFTIISNSPDEISNAILEKMNRGVTILSAKGGYTKEFIKDWKKWDINIFVLLIK